MLIRYKGSVGTAAENEFGKWQAGEARELPDRAAESLLASGCFEEAAPPPKSKKEKHAEPDPLD